MGGGREDEKEKTEMNSRVAEYASVLVYGSIGVSGRFRQRN
jgi:hypothetical protein